MKPPDPPPISSEETDAQLLIYQSGTPTQRENARQTIIDGYSRYLWRIASKTPAHQDIEDRYQAAMIGLMEAISTFSPEGGASFKTHAVYKIRSAIRSHAGLEPSHAPRMTDYVDETHEIPDPQMENHDQILTSAINRLDDSRIRDILLAHFWDNETINSISERYKLSRQTVSRLISRGLDALRRNTDIQEIR